MISIIIPIYNQHDMTRECIQAVMENTTDYELILVDNGSEPPFEPQFTGFNECRVIRNEKNIGFPAAINQGIRDAKGEIIVLLNNDVIVTPLALNRLDDWVETFDIVGPLTNYCAGLQRVELPVYQNRDELDYEANDLFESNEGEGTETNWIIGFCMAFEKSLYDELGEFDESLWPCSGEEIDFCLRAKKAGYKVGIALDIYVHHEGSLTFKDLQSAGVADYEKICERNNRHLAERWGNNFWANQAIFENVRLNLGCGSYHLKGFINVDQFANVQPDLVANALDLPYDPETVDEIYCGHMLEHLTLKDGIKALKYWHGLLKPGGAIRVTVPDFDYLAAEHLKHPTTESIVELNDLYIFSYVQESPHKYCYNEALLKEALKDAGFKNLERLPVDHEYFVDPVPWQVGYKGEK